MAVGLNIHRFDGAVADAVLEIQPPVIVVSHPDWSMVARWRASFRTTVIYRHILPDNPDGHGVDGGDYARAALTAVLPHRGLVDAIQGYNEAISSGNVVEQAQRELAFVRAVQAAGVPAVGLNAAVGNLEPEHVPLLLDLWREAAAVGYHGYCRPYGFDLDSGEWPWHLRRPEALWLPTLQRHGLGLGKVLLTETGTFYAPFPAMSPKDYAVLLCQIDDYARSVGMLGTAAFTLSGWEPWQTVQPWELVGTEAVGVLAAYNRQHRTPAPQLRIPAKTVPASKPVVPPKKEPPVNGYPGAVFKPSPNFGYPTTGARGRGGERILAIVDHIAAGTQAGLDAWLTNPQSGVSAHYGVMRDGSIHQYVRDEDAAWGAGMLQQPDESLPWLPPVGWARGATVNKRVISIEHEGQPGQPFTPQQVAATIALHRYLCERWGIPADRQHIVGHYRLDSVNRANCPGAAFPWEELFSALEGGEELTEQQIKEVLALCNVVWGNAEHRVAKGVELGQAEAELKSAVIHFKEVFGIADRVQ